MLHKKHNTIFLSLFFSFLIISLVSSTPTRFPPKGNGFTASLIPPTSPRSPFYNQILNANNIPINKTNITLDQSHYLKWLMTKSSISQNDYSDATFNKDVSYVVMDLYMGDGAQLVYGIFDTGSDITWFQCQGSPARKFPHFNQGNSSTYKPIDCNDHERCLSEKGQTTCIRDLCRFDVHYMSGNSVRGIMSSDITTLKPDWEIFQDFVFGCSTVNDFKLPGIIGASNSSYGMPRQLYPNNPKFSYCYSSNQSKTSYVKFGGDAILTGRSLNIKRDDAFIDKYFMDVSGFQVNGENIDVDPIVYLPGRGFGFIIDSGTSVIRLTSIVFGALVERLSRYLGKPTMYEQYEICYPSSTFGSIWPYKARPIIGIQFRDSAMWLETWTIELNMLWTKIIDKNLECIRIMRSTANFSILGAEPMLDWNIGHDLQNSLLYLSHTSTGCPDTP